MTFINSKDSLYKPLTEFERLTKRVEILEELLKGKLPSVGYDDTTIISKIDIISYKINIQLKNKIYYEEFFKPDFVVENSIKFSLLELLDELNDFKLISIPFLTNELIDVICSNNNYTSAKRDKFNNTIQYLGKLVFLNNDSVNTWQHYTAFWLFNNIDLSKSYPDLDSITQLMEDEIKKLINDTKTLYNNNNLDLLITELQKSTPSPTTIKNYLQNIPILPEQRDLTLYLNMCINLGAKIDESNLPATLTLNEYISSTFVLITGRNFFKMSPEEAIHVFN
jgi:hypothetical protein